MILIQLFSFMAMLIIAGTILRLLEGKFKDHPLGAALSFVY